MGKPTDLITAPAAGSGSGSGSSRETPGDVADAVSLRTHPGDRFIDADVPEIGADDLPPLYSEIDQEIPNTAPLLPPSQPPQMRLPENYLNTYALRPHYFIDGNSGLEVFIDKEFDVNTDLLEKQIELSATKPPRPFIRIHGTHMQTVENNGKKERKAVTDFDIKVELTPYLYTDVATGMSQRQMHLVENNEKAHRGTVFRCRAPGARSGAGNIELGDAKPTLKEWCHRYCASHAGLKSFALRRHTSGLDVQGIEGESFTERLKYLVRSTNYRGSISISYPVQDEWVYFYNECRTNRWRHTIWIVWMCYLTFLWLLTWPYLWLRTKRFEVVHVEWPLCLSDETIYNLWGRAISRAVLERRQGTLTQQDLIASQTIRPSAMDELLDSAPPLLRLGVDAMTAVNARFGWGGDQ